MAVALVRQACEGQVGLLYVFECQVVVQTVIILCRVRRHDIHPCFQILEGISTAIFKFPIGVVECDGIITFKHGTPHCYLVGHTCKPNAQIVKGQFIYESKGCRFEGHLP